MHTCSRTTSSTSYKRKGTPRLVASLLHKDFPSQFHTPDPKSLVSLVIGKFVVPVSYSTAYRGKQLAVSDIRGSPEESFKIVYSYLYMLEKVNHGTKTSVVLDEGKRFKYLFVALGASIEGFQVMRKVIVVDATFLKTVYDGVLIFASAQDPNHHHYPIAFAVADGEKEDTWMWFFKTLKTIIPDSPELVFISDRNASLIKAVGGVYPSSHHGHCIDHLSQNVMTKVTFVNKDDAAAKFRQIAQIYTITEFEKQYEDFRMRFPKAATYLDTTCEVEKWARCYFPGLKYNIQTSNVVESMNSVFKQARKFALLPMIDTIVAKFAEWFNNHRKESVGGSNAQKLVPFVENVLHDRCEIASKLTVIELNSFQLEYSVIGPDGKTYVVDLRNKSCICPLF
ncbi:Protein FAR1-RELATED SEQUENCE 5 [Cardamine amara subsp. amara]|uniref:Protein FAR1-RELATED SEQUENCE 5 n=1 Tax=Cardamine amara subsp. amara TaxID=228776 RepID=A0ABD0ZY93_CARAN